MAVSAQQQEFAARLARIERAGPTHAELLAGVMDEHIPEQSIRAALRPKTRRFGVSAMIKLVAGLPFAVLIGSAAMLAGHVLEFRFSDQLDRLEGLMGVSATGAADFVVAGVLALLVLSFLKLRGLLFSTAAMAGFGLMILHEIDLARSYPEIWGQLYSQGFVARSLQAGEMLHPEFPISLRSLT